MQKFFGLFKNANDVASEFEEGKWFSPDETPSSRYNQQNRFEPADGMPTDDEILFASYETPGYAGKAFVLYERDGKLYEAEGSHCSCYGLEGQWKPEETSWAALAMRIGPKERADFNITYSCDDAAWTRLKELVGEHTA